MGANTGYFWVGRSPHTNSSSLYLKLLFQLHGLKQLLAKHSPSQSFKDGRFVQIFLAVIFCEFSHSELGIHFPNWILRHIPIPKITNFLNGYSTCHSVKPHLEESLTTSECLYVHYLDFDRNLWGVGNCHFFLGAQVTGIHCGVPSSQRENV